MPLKDWILLIDCVLSSIQAAQLSFKAQFATSIGMSRFNLCKPPLLFRLSLETEFMLWCPNLLLKLK